MTRRPYLPRAFAQGVMDHLCANPRCALWAKPGMGKSVLTLHYLDLLHNVVGESRPSLVIAPLRVARDVWSNECRKWDSLRGLEVVPIVGSPSQRLKVFDIEAPVYTINYEALPWLVEQFPDGKWPFATVIADESIKLKSFRTRQGGARAKVLGKIAHRYVDRWINLTGTPSPNGLADLWGQTWFLDRGERLGATYTAFNERWFRPVKMGNFTTWKPLPHARAEIEERVVDLCMSLDPKDWFDLRKPVVNMIQVTLPKLVRVKYSELEKDFFTMISGYEIEAISAAAKSGKLLQLANGAMYTSELGEWVECHREKIEALQELVDETGDDPLLVVYQFKSDLVRLRAAFPGALNLATESDLTLAKAGQGKVWLAQPAAIAEGVDGLQAHCHTIVYFAQDWNLGLHDQILERIGPTRQFQSGKDRAVFVHYIVATDTIDEVVMERRSSKREIQELLLEYVRRKK